LKTRDTTEHPTQRATLGWLAVLMLIGAALRCYRLGEQSIWLDEFLSILTLKADSAAESLRFLGIYFPEHAQCPVFYALNYYWASAFGSDLVTVRMFPVIIGVLTIPLFYHFARSLYGHRIALVAALCYTLSPQHIWHAQEPRQYTLITPLVIIALYALRRALQDRNRAWWLLNIAANTVLVWTHMLNVLFLLVQGLFMLVFFRRMFTRMTIWALVQLTLLLPWTFWMLAMPFQTGHDGGGSVQEMFSELFLDEIVSFHSDLLPPFKTNTFETLSPLAKSLLPAQPLFDGLFAALLLGSVAYFLFSPIVRRSGWQRTPNVPPGAEDDREKWVLLLLLLIVPGLVLGVLAMMLKVPLIGPMYAMYSTLALYIALGVLIVRFFPRRYSFPIGILLLVVLYAYQLALVLPEVTRANWLEVVEKIERESSPSDRIFDMQFFGPANELAANWPDNSLPHERVWTIEAAVDRASAFLANPHTGEHTGERSAWIVYVDYIFQHRWPDGGLMFDRTLRERGLMSERVRFPGHYNIELIRVWTELPVQPREGNSALGLPGDLDHVALAATALGLARTSTTQHPDPSETLRHCIPFWPPMTPLFAFSQAATALAYGDVVVAEALQRWAIKRYPGVGLQHFGLGVILAAQASPEAPASFDEAYRLYPALGKIFRPYSDLLLSSEDCDECLAMIASIESRGYVSFAPALRTACELRAAAISKPLPESEKTTPQANHS